MGAKNSTEMKEGSENVESTISSSNTSQQVDSNEKRSESNVDCAQTKPDQEPEKNVESNEPVLLTNSPVDLDKQLSDLEKSHEQDVQKKVEEEKPRCNSDIASDIEIIPVTDTVNEPSADKPQPPIEDLGACGDIGDIGSGMSKVEIRNDVAVICDSMTNSHENELESNDKEAVTETGDARETPTETPMETKPDVVVEEKGDKFKDFLEEKDSAIQKQIDDLSAQFSKGANLEDEMTEKSETPEIQEPVAADVTCEVPTIETVQEPEQETVEEKAVEEQTEEKPADDEENIMDNKDEEYQSKNDSVTEKEQIELDQMPKEIIKIEDEQEELNKSENVVEAAANLAVDVDVDVNDNETADDSENFDANTSEITEAADASPAVETDQPDIRTIPVYWKESAEQAFVAGSFNEWQQWELMKNVSNEFHLDLKLQPGKYELKFFVDNEWKLVDYLDTEGENNVLTVE